MSTTVRNLSKRRRIQMLGVAGVMLALSTALIGTAFRDGIQFFMAPTEIIANPPDPRETFRIGGIVEHGSIRRQGALVDFSITDGTTSIAVKYEGITPDLFREGEGVIATGRMVDGTVEAIEVLARHDEFYVPRELAGMAPYTD